MTLEWQKFSPKKEAFNTPEFQFDISLECVQKRLKFAFESLINYLPIILIFYLNENNHELNRYILIMMLM